jgi:pantothenate kinase type III
MIKNQQIKIYSTENVIIDTGTSTVCNIVKRENAKYGRTVLNGIKYTVKQLANESDWMARVNFDIITRIKNIKGLE